MWWDGLREGETFHSCLGGLRWWGETTAEALQAILDLKSKLIHMPTNKIETRSESEIKLKNQTKHGFLAMDVSWVLGFAPFLCRSYRVLILSMERLWNRNKRASELREESGHSRGRKGHGGKGWGGWVYIVTLESPSMHSSKKVHGNRHQVFWAFLFKIF